MAEDKHLKQTLTKIAEQAIPETVNLWPRIEQEINAPINQNNQKKTSHNWRYYGRAAAAIIFTLFFSIVTYGLYQSNLIQTNDAGLTQVQHHVLNLQQSKKNVTVILDWVYADAHRITVNYSGIYDRNEFELQNIGRLTLTTQDGIVLPEIGGGGGGGGENNDGQRNNAVFTSNAIFDTTAITNDTTSLDLRLVINLIGNDRGHDANNPSSMVPDTDTIQFVFDFTTPYVPATIIETEQIAQSNDIALILRQISVTPSMSKATLCHHNLTDEGVSWQVKSTLQVGSESAEGADILTNSECFIISYPIFWNQQPAKWQITITSLQALPIYSEENAQIARDIMQGYGYEVEIIEIPGNAGQQSTMYIVPANNTADINFGSAVEAATAAISPEIEGNWTFSGTLN